jgi:hypothetical protein
MKAAYGIKMLAALIVLGTGAADAQSLKMRQRMASEAADLVKDAGYTNQVCGTSLSVKFDWSGAPDQDILGYSPEGYCNAALEGIRRVCEDAIGKDAVKKTIKSVTCGFAAARAIEMKDGAVDYKINFSSANDADFVFEYLQNKL